MTSDIQFSFRPRWKEELVCECELGHVVLDMPMGVVSVYPPTSEAWHAGAPGWAVPLWESFNAQLTAWCDLHKIPMYPGEGWLSFEPAK